MHLVTLKMDFSIWRYALAMFITSLQCLLRYFGHEPEV